MSYSKPNKIIPGEEGYQNGDAVVEIIPFPQCTKIKQSSVYNTNVS